VKLADIVDQLVIDPRKLTEYALNYRSERGKDKALVFEQVLGFTLENYQGLLRQLETNCLGADAKLYRAIEQGVLYQVDIVMEGKDNRQAVVRTGWIVKPGTRVARLTTVYVLGR